MSTKQKSKASDGSGPERVRRTTLLRVRVLPEEIDRWRAAADLQGSASLSHWLRSLADQAEACGEDPAAWRRDLVRLARDLNAGIGNNLNQIARTRAKGEAGTDTATMLMQLTLLAQELAQLRGAIDRKLGRRRRGRGRTTRRRSPGGESSGRGRSSGGGDTQAAAVDLLEGGDLGGPVGAAP